jgi:hypothetical protein
MNTNSFAGRRSTFSVAGLIALASMIVVLALTGISESHAAGDHMTSLPTRTAKAVAFHDHMRALWEAHGSWTHMVIVSFVGNLPNLPAGQALLRNRRRRQAHQAAKGAHPGRRQGLGGRQVR